LKCPRHKYQYDHWNWELADGAIIQDHGFSRSSLSTIPENTYAISDIREVKIFEKKEFGQMASREASLDIFRWFCINGEGLPPESIYQDDWLQEIWEEDETGTEADEANDQDFQGFVGQSEDQIESWLNKIS
jgi:hypothetical protein